MTNIRQLLITVQIHSILGDEHFKQAPNTLKFVMANTGIHPAEIDPKIKSKCFDQSKISVHFAIIPTAQSVDISKMTEQERKVYLAIAKRYMLQFLPPAKKMRTTLTAPLPNGGKCSFYFDGCHITRFPCIGKSR